MRTYVRMEIACVVDGCLATPRRPGPAGGLRPGRESFDGAGDRAMDDPVAAAERGEAMAAALEGIGAAVETERSGEIFFSVGGLKGLYGGDVAGVVAVAEGVVGAASAPVGEALDGRWAAALIGVPRTGPAARAAAARGLPRVTPPRLAGFLGSLPTAVLLDRLGEPRRAGEELGPALARLGVDTLGPPRA